MVGGMAVDGCCSETRATGGKADWDEECTTKEDETVRKAGEEVDCPFNAEGGE